MNIGFFTVYRRDPIHLLHAEALVRACHQHMPGQPTIQLTDETTPEVPGVSAVRRLPHGPMLERRLEHYATAEGNWLLLDTDTTVLRDVADVFDGPAFDVALSDRNWPHLTQGDPVMHTMPFNTGVVFSRTAAFWRDVLAVWRAYDSNARGWLSEQRAVYDVVRTGHYRVKILPGMVYNYPPRSPDDAMRGVCIAHFKGPRKEWLSDRILAAARTAPVEQSA